MTSGDLTRAQRQALVKIARGEFSGIQPRTFGALVEAGLIRVSHREREESYRPSRYGFTRQRHIRTRIYREVTLTPAGRLWAEEWSR
jgi:hypothetical protein